MNIHRGLSRFFVAVCLLWIAGITYIFPLTIDQARSFSYWENLIRTVSTPNLTAFLSYALLPPLALSFLFSAIVWIARGFKEDRGIGQNKS